MITVQAHRDGLNRWMGASFQRDLPFHPNPSGLQNPARRGPVATPATTHRLWLDEIRGDLLRATQAVEEEGYQARQAQRERVSGLQHTRYFREVIDYRPTNAVVVNTRHGDFIDTGAEITTISATFFLDLYSRYRVSLPLHHPAAG